MADAARSQQVMAGAAPARRPAVHRRLRHRLLVAVLPARAARRRAQARPQLRQPPDVGRAGRGDRPQHAAAEPGPRHEHGRRGRRGRRDAGGAARLGLRRRAGLPHRPAHAGRASSSAGWPSGPAPRTPVPLRRPVPLPSLPARRSQGPRDRIRTCRSPRRAGRRRPRAAGRPHLARTGGGALRRLAAARGRRLHRPGQLRPRRRRAAGPTCPAPSPRSPAGTPPAASGRARRCPRPGPSAADAAFAAAGWTRDDDNLVLTAALDGWAEPRVRGRPRARPRTTPGWPATATAARRCRRSPAEILVNADDPVFAAVRCSPAPAPLAAVARGVLVDGWLCVTAVTVDERSPAARPGDGGDGRARRLGARARWALLPAAGRRARTRRRWPSTSGWASPSTTATTTGWAPIGAASSGLTGGRRGPPSARPTANAAASTPSSRNARLIVPVAPPPVRTRSPSGRRIIAATPTTSQTTPGSTATSREPDSRSASTRAASGCRRRRRRTDTRHAARRRRAAAARRPPPAPARPRRPGPRRPPGHAARTAGRLIRPDRRTGRPPSRARPVAGRAPLPCDQPVVLDAQDLLAEVVRQGEERAVDQDLRRVGAHGGVLVAARTGRRRRQP